MCDPGTIAVAALSIGGAILEHKAQNKAAEENKIEALKALRINERDIGARQMEEQMSFAQAATESEVQQLGVEGTTRASAASAGVEGMSVDLLLGDIGRQGANYRESLASQLQVSVDQLQRMKAGATATAQSRINQVPRANPFATALRIGGALAGAHSSLAGKVPSTTTTPTSNPMQFFIPRGAMP